MVESTVDVGKSRKGGLRGLAFGLIAGLLAGGGAFYAAYAGLLPKPAAVTRLLDGGGDKSMAKPTSMAAGVAFAPLRSIVVTLAPTASADYLQFTAEIETTPEALAEVQALEPRILDVLHTYLRAVDAADLEQPAMMSRLRAQLLRRVRMVAGAENVRDLLITEFVLN